MFSKIINNNETQCLLCPHNCILQNNQLGRCLVRQSLNSEIILKDYGNLSTIAVEPIEKKPFYHFMPNTKVLSIGSWGCNMSCSFCQNFMVSQQVVNEKSKYFSPENIVKLAVDKNVQGLCMTYNEPTIHFEYLLDISKELKKYNLYFVIKTNACLNNDPWIEICNAVDAMNVDIKGSLQDYKDVTFINEICYNQVIDNIKYASQLSYDCKINLEISMPIYPHMSDNDKWLIDFRNMIYSIDENIPIHLLKVFPAHQVVGKWKTTDDKNIFAIRKKLLNRLNFVYVSNVFSEEGSEYRKTIDPVSGNVLATRKNMTTTILQESYYIRDIV